MLAILGPTVTHLLVSQLSELQCGKWGLQCAFYVFLGTVGSWSIGTGLAAYGLRRNEPRWLGTSALVVNLLALLAMVGFALRLLIR